MCCAALGRQPLPLALGLSLGALSVALVWSLLTSPPRRGVLAAVDGSQQRMAMDPGAGAVDGGAVSDPLQHGPSAGGVVSLQAEVPAALLASMRAFIERHPNWDQYRLVQAALAGFLVQNGSSSRDVTRCYLANLFPAQRRFTATPPSDRGPWA